MSGNRSDIETVDTNPDFESGPQPAVNPRDAMMARIAAKREAQIEEEVAAASGHQDEQLPEHDSAIRPANPNLGELEEDREYSGGAYAERDESVAPRQPSPSRRQTDHGQVQPQVYPLELDGQIVYVTAEQQAHLAQMGAIASQALQQYQSQTQPQYQQTVRQEAPAPAPELRDVVRALQYGDEETAEKALDGFLKARPDPEQVVNRRLQEMTMQQRLAADTEVVRREYSDIMSDPIRADAAARQVAALRQQHGWDPSVQLAIYREAGNRVRQSFGTGASQSVQQGNLRVSRDVDGITERKRSAPSRTAAVIDRRSGSGAPEGSRGPSPSEIVATMRAARGQR